MKGTRGALLAPVLLILVGVSWLLNSLGVMPGVNWVWTLLLAGVGLLILLGGLNRISVVLGPLLMVAGGLSVLRQTGRLNIDVEIPILVILAGVLLIVSRYSRLPAPAWLTDGRTGS